MKRHQIIMLAVLFVFALWIRIAYQNDLQIVNPIRNDAAKYVTIAYNLINNGLYSEEPQATRPSYSITPGYPFFLAAIIKLTGDGTRAYNATLYSQTAMGAGASVLAVLIALYFLPFRFAFPAGILTSISPLLITLGGYVLTETLFTFLLLAALWALLRGMTSKSMAWVVCAGILLGWAALVRPAIIAFPLFVFPLLLLVNRQNWRVPVALLLAAAIVHGSWVGWTKLHADVAVSSPSLLSHTLALGIYPDLTFKDPEMKGYPYREDPEYEKFANSLGLTLHTLKERSQSQPWRYLNWYLFGKPVMFWANNMLENPDRGVYIYPVISSLYDVNVLARGTMEMMQFMHPFMVLTVFLGGIGVYYLRRKERVGLEGLNLSTIIYALLVCVTLIHMVLTPLPRYSVPFRPLLYIIFMVVVFHAQIFVRRNAICHDK